MREYLLHLALVDAFYGTERAVQLLFRRFGRVISCIALNEIRERLKQPGIVLLRSTINDLLWALQRNRRYR